MINKDLVEQFEKLEYNWNSYGALPISQEVLNILKHMFIVPTSEGGMQIEWHCNGRDVEIYIEPNGDIELSDE